MKITYANINSGDFAEALKSLGRKKFKTIGNDYNLVKISSQIRKERELALELYTKIARDYFATDEAGNYIPLAQPTQINAYVIKPGFEADFVKKMDEFLSTEVEIRARKFTLDDIKLCGLTANEIMALEPILDLTSFEQLDEPRSVEPLPV